MRGDSFFHLADQLCERLRPTEILFCNLDGERSDFVRFNKGRIRQAGAIARDRLCLTLIDGRRQADSYCDLNGDAQADLALLNHLLGRLRDWIAHVPDDPYLNYSTTPTGSERRVGSTFSEVEQALAQIAAGTQGMDMVGIFALGTIAAGLASSVGHRHWHTSSSFNLDFSCHLKQDKAIKASYSGFLWEPDHLHDKLTRVRSELEVMAQTPRTITPGHYRAYLAPEAVAELLDTVAWGGFGLRDHRTAQTPLLRLARGERALDPRIALREEHARGLVPVFTGEGFMKPDAVTLIEQGRYRDCLTDSRSAMEYGTVVNAAGEYPESLAMDPGDMPVRDVLARLGTGLFIGNLWYLNYADRNDCRITGMTRFGTYWIEDGQPVGPVEVMRFDDSVYDLLGARLEGLTRERELILSADTYDGRSAASVMLPGLLVSGIRFTL